jgi:hypothetical protein
MISADLTRSNCSLHKLNTTFPSLSTTEASVATVLLYFIEAFLDLHVVVSCVTLANLSVAMPRVIESLTPKLRTDPETMRKSKADARVAVVHGRAITASTSFSSLHLIITERSSFAKYLKMFTAVHKSLQTCSSLFNSFVVQEPTVDKILLD